MNYEEKKELKLERLRRLHRNAKANSRSFYERSNTLSRVVPFGQPILVGHHSERSHRNLIKKIHSSMDKFVTEQNKAEYYEERIKAVENNMAISSDCSDAEIKLTEKLKKLEEQREKIKQHNKEQRKLGKEGSAHWVLSNLGQNIRSVKQRILQLQKQRSIKEVEETYGNIKLKVSQEANRVQLFFDGKPELKTRTKLKQNGFRWSPYNGCWQSYLKEWNIKKAREIAQEVA